MVEQAIVNAVEGNRASVVLCPADQCDSCVTCNLFGGRKARAIKAANPEGLDIKAGDLVELYTNPGKAVWAAFQVLILPLLLFLGLYALAQLAGVVSEWLRITAGALGLGVGFLLAAFRGNREQNLPRIASVVSGARQHPLTSPVANEAQPSPPAS